MNSKTTASRKSVSTLPMLVVALFLGLLTVGSTSARAAATPLALINDWSTDLGPGQLRHPAVVIFNGLVHFKGAMIQKQGNNPEPFVLPPGFRPATMVFVPITLFLAKKGRLVIYPSGEVLVEAEHSFTSAQTFTSLDGASFAPSDAGFTPLTLINGWTNAPFSTSNSAVENINGIVHFKGAIATASSSPDPFVLPVGFRPAAMVFVPVDLCNSANGRLVISPSGIVEVQAENTFSSAQCFTSLDGAWFAAAGATGFKNLKLIEGWKGEPFGTGKPAVKNTGGVVYLKGAVAGAPHIFDTMFILPVADRPSFATYAAYINVDLCDAHFGVLDISYVGDVSLDSSDSFSSGKCFTSLDGVSYVK